MLGISLGRNSILVWACQKITLKFILFYIEKLVTFPLFLGALHPVPPTEPAPQSSSTAPDEAPRPDSLTVEIQQASPNRKARIVNILRGEPDEEPDEKEDRLSVSPSPSPKCHKRKWGDDDPEGPPDSEDEPIPGKSHYINYQM